MTRLALSALLAIALFPGWPSPLGSPSPEDDLKRAVDAYSRADYAQARALLDFVQQEPGATGGRAAYLLGVIDLQQKKFALAEISFTEAASKLPVLADHALYYRAVAQFDGGRFEQAAQGFQEVLTLYPTSTLRGLALFWEAESLWGAHAPEAPAAFHRYLEEFGQGAHAAQAWFDMGEALVQLDRWGDAAQAYRRVRWGFEGSPFWEPARARLTEIGAVHTLPPDATPPEVFYRRALADIDAGLFGAAREELLHVLAMPDGWRIEDQAVYTLGVLAFQRRSFGEAESYFNKSVRLHRAHADDSLYYLERIALARGREADALDLANTLIRTFPQSSLAPRSLYAIAETREDRGASGPALALFREVAERFPNTQWGQRALWAVGWVQYQTGQWKAARAIWLRLTQQGPDAEGGPAAQFWAARAAETLGLSDVAAGEYRHLAVEAPETYYGQRAAAHLNLPLRVTTAPSQDLQSAEIPTLERFRELDALAQIDDATSELAAAAELGPSRDREAVGLALSERYEQQGDVRRGIATAEQVQDMARTAGHDAPLALWEALYPQAYWETIGQAASRTGVDAYLMAGLIREESRFDPTAVSSADAIGLMQLIPGTARSAARLAGLPAPDRRGLTDPQTNIALGSTVLQELMRRYTRADLALAAYNAGPDAVGRWEARRGSLEPDAFIEEIPYVETRGYVKTVLQSAGMYQWLYRDGHPSSSP